MEQQKNYIWFLKIGQIEPRPIILVKVIFVASSSSVKTKHPEGISVPYSKKRFPFSWEDIFQANFMVGLDLGRDIKWKSFFSCMKGIEVVNFCWPPQAISGYWPASHH